MSLLKIEGFDHMSSDTRSLAAKGWTLGGVANISHFKDTGRFGGSSYRCNYVSIEDELSLALSNKKTVTLGVAINHHSGFNPFFILYDGSTVQCYVGIDGPTGLIKAYRGSGSTNLLGSGTTVIAVDTWYYIEVTATIDNSAGSITVNLNGEPEISLTGLDTQSTSNSYATKLSIVGNSNTARNCYIDDVYIRDDGTFMGDVRVETLYPDSNSSVAWTPLSGFNYQNVDEADVDGDTSYNSATASGTIDLFNHSLLSTDPSVIHAVQLSSYMKKDDAGAVSGRNKLLSGATTFNGASLGLSSSYLYSTDLLLTDPDTSAAWTRAGINAAQIGYERV